ETVDVALNGDRSLPPIRGGSQAAILNNETDLTLSLVIQCHQQIDYLYNLGIEMNSDSLNIFIENIKWKGVDNELKNEITILNRYNDQKSGLVTNMNVLDSNEVIDNIKIDDLPLGTQFHKEFAKKMEKKLLSLKPNIKKSICEQLQSIFIVDPIPSKMRDFSRLSENLEQDTSNIAGVLAALPHEQKAEVEATLSHYLEHFPEGDIKKVWAEKVGRLGTDAMLYCQEEWQSGQITEIDARSMSDGTLRLLGILTALLTRPEGSLIVIEEIDNGLHPSRAELLVKILREIGTKRKIDLLITTHNPALLDALGPEIIPFVTVVHRDAETGESKLTLLEDIDNLPKLLATGSLGKLATKGTIEKTLAQSL
ncbi:MAG: AAA family ATPase, partial [Microcystaceae cyanobacterium]